MMSRSTIGRASPPYSSGQVSPIQPLAETFLVKATANSQKSSSSQYSVDCSHCEGSSLSRNSRTSSRHSICSLVKLRSITTSRLPTMSKQPDLCRTRHRWSWSNREEPGSFSRHPRALLGAPVALQEGVDVGQLDAWIGAELGGVARQPGDEVAVVGRRGPGLASPTPGLVRRGPAAAVGVRAAGEEPASGVVAPEPVGVGLGGPDGDGIAPVPV